MLKEFTATYAHIEASVHIELLAPFIGQLGWVAPALELRTRAEASMVEPQSVTVNGYDLAQYVWGDVYDERFPDLAPPSVVALDARHNAIENLHGLEFFPLLAALNVGGNCLRSLRCQACPPPRSGPRKLAGVTVTAQQVPRRL